MVNPIPDNIKEILSQLNGPQQVALRTYIASLRAEIKDLEGELKTKDDPNPNAHYHGEHRCTADHSHSGAEHHSHGEKHKDHHAHKHEHHHGHEECNEDHSHEHSHASKHEHSHEHHKEHDHEHHEHKEHKHHEHHGHDHHHNKKKEEVPAWKKAAQESGNDATAAPFGGSWNEESNVSAKGHKTEEG
jgi:hypothetical protein